jgi:aspartate aminotransferase-like enzyme
MEVGIVHKKYLSPSVEVRQDVLEKMATPMIGHRSKNASIAASDY